MAEGGEKRDPKSHRTPSQIKRHGRTYQATPERRKYRSALNKANRENPNSKKGDGKDMSHKKPHAKGGSSAKGNLTLKKQSSNRAHYGKGGAVTRRVRRGK